MNTIYLVSAKDGAGNKFIYETAIPATGGLSIETLATDILSGEYDVGPLGRVVAMEWDQPSCQDVTVQVAEAVRELVIASEQEPPPLIRNWINMIGIDPIPVQDGH